MGNTGIDYQWIHKIDGLIPSGLSFTEEVWLEPDKVLLKIHNGELYAHVRSKDNDQASQKKILPLLWISQLVSSNIPRLETQYGASLHDDNPLGSFQKISIEIRQAKPPKELTEKISNEAPQYLNYLMGLQNKLVTLINKNPFLENSLNYFSESRSKGVHEYDGFMAAMIALESLFNEAPSDVKYKIALRSAILLSLFDECAIEAFESIQKLYKVRSDIVHNGKFKCPADVYHLEGKVRKSIIGCIIIMKSKLLGNDNDKKKAFVKLLDHAALNQGKLKLLKETVDEGRKELRSDVKRTFTYGAGETQGVQTAW